VVVVGSRVRSVGKDNHDRLTRIGDNGLHARRLVTPCRPLSTLIHTCRMMSVLSFPSSTASGTRADKHEITDKGILGGKGIVNFKGHFVTNFDEFRYRRVWVTRECEEETGDVVSVSCRCSPIISFQSGVRAKRWCQYLFSPGEQSEER